MTTTKKPEADGYEQEDGKKWAFDEKVTDSFLPMIQASIPGYAEMRRLTYDLADRWLTWGPQHVDVRGRTQRLIDLGSSRGDAVAELVAKHSDRVRFVLNEISQPMREVLASRWSPDLYLRGSIVVSGVDLRYPESRRELLKSDSSDFTTGGSTASHFATTVIQSILTMIFIPVEHRQSLINDIYHKLAPGGAFFMVEKMIGSDPFLDEVFTEEYLKFKRRQGYSEEAVTRKRLSLEGVLVPLKEEWNRDMLRAAGFRHVETYWRSLNFCGIVAVKG